MTQGPLFLLLLQDEAGDKNVDMVLKCAQSFVLKPQREGGGKPVRVFYGVMFVSSSLVCRTPPPKAIPPQAGPGPPPHTHHDLIT